MYKVVLQIVYSTVRGGEGGSSVLFSKQWDLMCVSVPVCKKYSTMTVCVVGKIGLYSCPHCSMDCLLMWRSCFFLSTFLVFSLNLFSAHHYKSGYLRTIKFSFGLYDAKIKDSVVYVVSNSYIIYYCLFCSCIYVRSVESVFITFFPPSLFWGAVWWSLCTTLYRTGIFVRDLALNHSCTQNTTRGLTFLHFVDVQGCFLYAQKFLL